MNSKLFDEIALKHSELSKEISRLSNAFMLLNNIRNIHRITVGATDILSPKMLHTAARLMGYPKGQDLYRKFKTTCAEVTSTIKNIIARFPCP